MRIPLAVAALLAFFVMSACSAAETITVDGTLTLLKSATRQAAQGECAGYRGMDDINAGTSVVVSDAAGVVIAAGELDPATDYSRMGACTFPFSVADVPVGDYYQVEVASRGQVVVSHADVVGGTVALSLG